jgi:hypothetical protein
MSAGSPRSSVTLEELAQTCERFWSAQGYVKWADVADVYGVSRQAIHSRLKQACDKGELNPETFERWSSPTSRLAASRRNRAASREREKLQVSIRLTAENLKWLREECSIRGVTSADVINGLITVARNTPING